TCTAIDRAACESLAKLAGLDLEDFADRMFTAGSNLKGKTAEEIFYQDFKRFTAGGLSFGVGQLTGTNRSELVALSEELLPLMEEKLKSSNLSMLFFMLTNILTEKTGLLCVGHGASQLIEAAFSGEGGLPIEWEAEKIARVTGLMSRKKQLVPQIIMAVQEQEG
ncbi:MAG: inorganic diphosphatase, partial [Firmicutes bacterium]|nr:inorganic diphosphatase [Bacillota bacterium]